MQRVLQFGRQLIITISPSFGEHVTQPVPLAQGAVSMAVMEHYASDILEVYGSTTSAPLTGCWEQSDELLVGGISAATLQSPLQP